MELPWVTTRWRDGHGGAEGLSSVVVGLWWRMSSSPCSHGVESVVGLRSGAEGVFV